ncbi:MAG: hypothetical protein KGJ89_00810 [Patescibacteria group bacterium]|nr:hypothetical protein [Patescibacteria group bacterium]MDE2015054.1 hypothetical protein [Patescibacteria group bacterium]MDE2226482.1 hypothetical protein [Patescibacteria group bacterium]
MTRDEEKQIILDALRRSPVIESACAKAGISRRTFYRRKQEDPAFAKEADEAQLDGKNLVNDAAESQIIQAIKQGKLNAAIFWLKNNKDEYRNRLELSGTVDLREELTPEEVELLREALRLAGFPANYINLMIQK